MNEETVVLSDKVFSRNCLIIGNASDWVLKANDLVSCNDSFVGQIKSILCAFDTQAASIQRDFDKVSRSFSSQGINFSDDVIELIINSVSSLSAQAFDDTDAVAFVKYERDALGTFDEDNINYSPLDGIYNDHQYADLFELWCVTDGEEEFNYSTRITYPFYCVLRSIFDYMGQCSFASMSRKASLKQAVKALDEVLTIDDKYAFFQFVSYLPYSSKGSPIYHHSPIFESIIDSSLSLDYDYSFIPLLNPAQELVSLCHERVPDQQPSENYTDPEL